MRQKQMGMSLIDVIIAIGIFTTAITGLFFILQGSQNAINTSMQRSIEAAFVQMKMAEVNPYDPSVETAYDITTKTKYNLPEGNSFWYTRNVTSTATEGDIKIVSMYLFRDSNSTTPYRQFRRELAPKFWGYNFGTGSLYYRDAMGNVWSPNTNLSLSTTTGSKQNGKNAVFTTAVQNGSGNCPTITGTPDGSLFQKGILQVAGIGNMTYTFLASKDRKYDVVVGFAETDPNGQNVQEKERIMTLNINNTDVETDIDPYGETGGLCRALVKRYTADPMDLGSGVYGIKVVVKQTVPDSTYSPIFSFVGIERRDF